MEKHLNKIRKAMLDSTFNNMEFSSQKKREVMESIRTLSTSSPLFWVDTSF
jgi:hypothetical protein